MHNLAFFDFLTKGTASRPHLVVQMSCNSLINQDHI